MRLKSVVKYNISGMKYSILIFYGVMVALFIILAVSMVNVSSNGGEVNYSGGGAEMASAIFLFVCGLNSFKQNYLFLSTNGITRKAQFYGFLIGSGAIATVMAAIDTTYGNILREFANYETLFNLIYKGFVVDSSKPLILLMNFLWYAVLYLFALVLGYLITTLYYRMSKILKIIVSVGVIVLLFNVLPTIDAVFNNGRVINWIYKLFAFSLGNGNTPLISVISFVIGTAILAGLAFLLVRRAPVKQ